MIKSDLNSRKTCVYRLFDADGVLLYVGASWNPKTRIFNHKDKPWWSQVAKSTIEWHPDRFTALRFEAKAIVEESPLYNVMGVDPDAVRSPRSPRAEPRDRSGRTLAQAMHAVLLSPWGASSNLTETQQRAAVRTWLRWKREAGVA